METPSMTSMGMKRKELHASEYPATPSSEKDYDNQMVYPSLHVTGKQAEMLGAPDLKSGEYIKQTVIWKVCDVETTDRNGEKSHRLTMDLIQASDVETVDAPEGEEKKSKKKSDSDESSPGLDYLIGQSAD